MSKIGIQSIEVGFPILSALVEASTPLSLKEIARRVAMPPSKVHRYLVSFIRVGLVQQGAQGANYDLGPNALLLGFAAMRRLDLLSVSERVMKAVRDTVDESVTLAVWSSNGPVIVRFMENSSPVSVNVRVGSSMPLLTSALGRVFLAWEPWDEVEPLASAELQTSAAASVGFLNIDDVKALRQRILNQGLAHVSTTMFPGVAAISAPIFDHQGAIKAAIAVVGPDSKISLPENENVIGELVRSAARDVSDLIGGFEKR